MFGFELVGAFVAQRLMQSDEIVGPVDLFPEAPPQPPAQAVEGGGVRTGTVNGGGGFRRRGGLDVDSIMARPSENPLDQGGTLFAGASVNADPVVAEGIADAADFASSFATFGLYDLHAWWTGEHGFTGRALTDSEKLWAGFGAGSAFIPLDELARLARYLKNGFKAAPAVARNVDNVLRHADEFSEGARVGAPKTLFSGRVNPFDLELTHGINSRSKSFRNLKADIAKNGIKEPIKFVEHNGKRYVVDGHHRLRAAKELGLKDVPVEEVVLPFKGYKGIDDLNFTR